MTAPLYFTRARLRHDASIAALKDLLVPTNEADRIATAHKLIWTLFADAPGRKRDFLWREAEPGLFYLLSARAPHDAHNLFSMDEPKIFAPALRAGDGLAFSLRANATISKQVAPRTRGRVHDIVMHAIHQTPLSGRADARSAAIESAGRAWFDRQINAAGAKMSEDAPLRVDGYRVLAPARRKGALSIGVLDFEGVIEVREPSLLCAAIARGFGRAKAFGFGLMLIRRT